MKWGEVIIDMRKMGTNPDYMDGFEYMAGKVLKYREENGLPNELTALLQNVT